MTRLGYMVLVCLAGCRSGTKAQRAEERPPIEAFVRAVHIHGVPYDKARAYGPDVVPRLLEMLEDPAEERHWANIVVTLCILADERAVESVLDFIEDGGGRLSRAEYRAKSSAVMALGYVVNGSGNRTCLRYLQGGVRPTAWPSRGVTWTAPGQSWHERNRSLSRNAVLGLALSGHPEAGLTLRALQPAAAKDGVLRAAAPDAVVATAVEEHAKVSALGLSEYYARAKDSRER